jgi:hypothetical protein
MRAAGDQEVRLREGSGRQQQESRSGGMATKLAERFHQ